MSGFHAQLAQGAAEVRPVLRKPFTRAALEAALGTALAGPGAATRAG